MARGCRRSVVEAVAWAWRCVRRVLIGEPVPATFCYQVAGHRQLSNEGGPIVWLSPGRIAKPVGTGYFAGEDQFYSTLERSPGLQSFCPAFYGMRTLGGRLWIVLEDLTHNLRSPCVVDIKLGTSTVAPDAPWTKRLTHLAKDRETTTRALGIRLIGALHAAETREGAPRLRLGKAWGKAVRPHQMMEALRVVFSVEGKLCGGALRHFVRELQTLLEVPQRSP